MNVTERDGLLGLCMQVHIHTGAHLHVCSHTRHTIKHTQFHSYPTSHLDKSFSPSTVLQWLRGQKKSLIVVIHGLQSAGRMGPAVSPSQGEDRCITMSPVYKSSLFYSLLSLLLLRRPDLSSALPLQSSFWYLPVFIQYLADCLKKLRYLYNISQIFFVLW